MPKDKVKGRPPPFGRTNLGRPAPERNLGPTERALIAGGMLGLLGAGIPQWNLNDLAAQREAQRSPAFVPPKKRRGR
jgi:hypothetical protein